MRHRSIGLRVGILIAVPVLCLVVLYAFSATLTLGNALRQSRATALRTQVGNPVSVFQLEVAAERGLAVLNLATPSSPQLAGELSTQEATTSKTLAQLQSALSSSAAATSASGAQLTSMRALVNQAAALNQVRAAVAARSIDMRTALVDYDSIIQSGYGVLDRLIETEGDSQQVTQAIDLVNLDRARQATIAEGDLLAGDMAVRRFSDADRMTIASLAATRQQLVAGSVPDLQDSYRAALDRYVTAPAGSAVTAAEAAVAHTPWHAGAAPATVVSASRVLSTYTTALEQGLLAAAAQLQRAAQHQGHTVLLQLIIVGGLGLVALIVSVALSLVLGRGLVRQLRELRESALTLANHTLPSIVSRLRAGQQVSLDDYAPRLVPTSNEIEQVGQAVSVLQYAAVQSAADEARVRRGINDVFRNLAGRSQSLLHRQLTLLDTMERQATDPDELESLFRIDHLTTRMRRHAEGLMILSGDTPARGWRNPVPLVDVLRAAVAEVEDYTRVRVLCRTSGAVSGHAVADIVHLLAELAENATVFSPPNTPVRMQGDSVGQGFVIEVEDRGLGISQARLEEINARLANPPQFDLSGSDRLGLFIVGQLARRHDITVTLRPSVYGGTTAIVLLPVALVADSDTLVPDQVLPARRNDLLQLERMPGGAAPSAIPAGNGHRGSGGFIFGQAAAADGDAGDGHPAPAPELSRPSTETATQPTEPAVAELTELGLPVRVRQASLAPQLRDAPPRDAGEATPVVGGFALPRRGARAVDPRPAPPLPADPGPASPEAARNVVSALQRGWQLGRADPAPEPAEPTADETSDEADED